MKKRRKMKTGEKRERTLLLPSKEKKYHALS